MAFKSKCPNCGNVFRLKPQFIHRPYCSLKCHKEAGYVPERYPIIKITMGEYSKLLEKANYQCEICERKDQKLCVDHNHKTGKIRGILCNGCNVSLPYKIAMWDTRAIKYIQKQYEIQA